MTSDLKQCGVRYAESGRSDNEKLRRREDHLPAVFLLVMGVLVIPAVSFALETASVITSSVAATPPVSVPEGTAPAVTAPAATVPAVTADQVVLVEAHYRGLVDLTAKVVQKNFLKSVGKTQTFEGSLSVKRPGKLRLEYTNGQVIVIDGRDAWFYSKKSSQAIRRTFQDFEQANIPVAFLLGAGAIRQDFGVVRPEADTPFLLDLVPKKPGAAMKKLRIHSDGSGGISRMIIFDKSGNTSDVVFTGVKEGVGLDDGLFKFKVPKGTEVIEQ